MAGDLVRDEVVVSAQTWVVKVGTNVLAGRDGILDLDKVGHLAEQISTVAATGRRIAAAYGLEYQTGANHPRRFGV